MMTKADYYGAFSSCLCNYGDGYLDCFYDRVATGSCISLYSVDCMLVRSVLTQNDNNANKAARLQDTGTVNVHEPLWVGAKRTDYQGPHKIFPVSVLSLPCFQ